MKKFSKKQWIKFGIAAVLYILFSIWMQNLWLLLGLIVLVDIFLTHYIPWGAWKRSKNPAVRNALEWVDDILFALVAVYFINLFVFQNYQIPSSSLEKSLLVGDYLFVSKLSYGPRVPNTPLSFPLVQNTLPFFNCKSYLDWPEWGYKRVKGFGHVKRNDIVVFNFPAGDTVALKQQNPSYDELVAMYGRDRIWMDKNTFGDVIYRPVDKRENYVKRCIGMPGDTIELRNNQVYIDGKAANHGRTVPPDGCKQGRPDVGFKQRILSGCDVFLRLQTNRSRPVQPDLQDAFNTEGTRHRREVAFRKEDRYRTGCFGRAYLSCLV